VKRSILITAAVLLLLLPSTARAYQVAIEAKASRAEVAKGEGFTYSLSIIEEGQANQPVHLVPPDFKGFNVTGTFSSSSVKVIANKARTVTEQEYRMNSNLPGPHVIGPAKLVLVDPKTGTGQTITSNTVKVTVLEKGPGLLKGIEEDIRDIKAPKTFLEKARLFFYLMVAVVILVFFMLLGLAIYMVRRRKAKQPAVVAPSRGAVLSARDEALAALTRAGTLKSDPKAFYSACVEAVRQYLKAAHNIPAPEATTTEIMAIIRKSNLRPEAVDRLWALLGEADLVKFAKHAPTDEEMTRFIEKARGLVKEI
jgi:hypothetical protein